jgi:hypothetical protein
MSKGSAHPKTWGALRAEFTANLIKPDAVSRYLVRPELPRGHVGAADGRGPSARTVRRVERAGERSRITQRLLESLRHPYTESQVYFVFYWYYTRTCSAYGGVRHTTASRQRLRDTHQRTFASDSWSTSVDAHASQLRAAPGNILLANSNTITKYSCDTRHRDTQENGHRQRIRA